jgi:hypothetical protein
MATPNYALRQIQNWAMRNVKTLGGMALYAFEEPWGELEVEKPEQNKNGSGG